MCKHKAMSSEGITPHYIKTSTKGSHSPTTYGGCHKNGIPAPLPGGHLVQKCDQGKGQWPVLLPSLSRETHRGPPSLLPLWLPQGRTQVSPGGPETGARLRPHPCGGTWITGVTHLFVPALFTQQHLSLLMRRVKMGTPSFPCLLETETLLAAAAYSFVRFFLVPWPASTCSPAKLSCRDRKHPVPLCLNVYPTRRRTAPHLRR